MNLFALIPLSALLINFFVWSVVYGQRRRDPVNRAFLLFNLFISSWILCEAAVFYTPLSDTVRLWIFRLSALTWMPVGILYLHFTNKLLGRQWGRDIVLYLGLATAGAITYIFTDLGVASFRDFYWGTGPVNGPYHSYLTMIPSIPAAVGLIKIWRAMRAAIDQNKRYTYALIDIGGAGAFFAVLILDVLLPNFFGLEDVPRFGSSAMAFFCLCIYLAVARFRFLTVSVERFSEELFHDVRDGIILLNNQNLIQVMNKSAEAMLATKLDEAHGRPIAELLGDQNFTEDFLDRDLSVSHDGTVAHFALSQSSISREGVGLGKIIMIRDVTAQKDIEIKLRRSRDELEAEVARRTEELYQAQKMEAIGTLAGGIAHDFNNLLAAILGFTAAAREDLPESSSIRTDLDEVLHAGRRARDIVQQLLTFSRRNEYHPKVIDLGRAIDESLRLLDVSIPSTVSIVKDLGAEKCWVLADATQINQIVMNLCANAAHALRMSRRKVLQIKLAPVDIIDDFANDHPPLRPGRHASLSVEDTGAGMDRATIARLFEPFFTTKAPGEGTGLGLSTVQSIVTSHDGAITVRSTPGSGTSFCIYLPMVAAGKTEEAREAVAPPGGSERILLVDDEQQLVRMGKRVLEPLGYDVTALKSSEEAWRTIREKPDDFDIVITDQTMPEMTGVTLAGRILKLRPKMPIILVSGYTDTNIGTAARAIGIRAYLHKPLSTPILAETIRAALDER